MLKKSGVLEKHYDLHRFLALQCNIGFINMCVSNRSIITGRNEVLAKVMFLHVSVILLTGGGACSKFSGGVPAPNFRGGACSKFSGGGACSKFSGGACSKFSGGGCLLQIFGGVPAPNFWGGACSKISGGGLIFRIRSTFGRYASYWNAFLLHGVFMLEKNLKEKLLCRIQYSHL